MTVIKVPALLFICKHQVSQEQLHWLLSCYLRFSKDLCTTACKYHWKGMGGKDSWRKPQWSGKYF